jgi:nucleoid-associated protein YgaU
VPNDAKLGLVIGVGLVIAVAVIFFRKDLVTAQPASDNPAGAAINPAVSPPAATPVPEPAAEPVRPARGKAVTRSSEGDAPEPAVRRHTVQEGETLFTLAQRYYGDGDRFVDLYRANRGVLKSPDALEPGTVLTIPDLP